MQDINYLFFSVVSIMFSAFLPFILTMFFAKAAIEFLNKF